MVMKNGRCIDPDQFVSETGAGNGGDRHLGVQQAGNLGALVKIELPMAHSMQENNSSALRVGLAGAT